MREEQKMIAYYEIGQVTATALPWEQIKICSVRIMNIWCGLSIQSITNLLLVLRFLTVPMSFIEIPAVIV